MSSKRYPKVTSSQWVSPVMTGLRFSCCDCHLVHNIDFRIRNGQVQARFRRNVRSTAALRRYRPLAREIQK